MKVKGEKGKLMKILVKYPTRQRPNKFLSTLNIWRTNVSAENQVRFVVSIDEDDATMNNPKMKAHLACYPDVALKVGTSKTKVEAINHGLEGEEFDMVILASDDMIPQVTEYDAVMSDHMSFYFPALDGALHYNDGFRGEGLCTLTVMGSRMYKYYGYLYHPAYKSLWCDNEFTETAKRRHKHKYISKVLVKHEHFSNTRKEKADSLQKRNDALDKVDKMVYEERARKNFGLKTPKLSILIPSLVTRAETLQRLIAELNRQIDKLPDKDMVEYHILVDNKEMSVGGKRNTLLDRARGEYICFIDDDDLVAENYITAILSAISQNPGVDCIAYRGLMTTDGLNPAEFYFSLKYGGNYSKGGVYYRTPNHLCPIRQAIAKARRFPEINYGEDSRWAEELYKSGLLKTEVVIPETLYYYLFSRKGTETQKPETKRLVRRYIPAVIYMVVSEDIVTRKVIGGTDLCLKKGEAVKKIQKTGDHILVQDKAGRKHVVRATKLTTTRIEQESIFEEVDDVGVVKGSSDSAGGGGRSGEDNTSGDAGVVVSDGGAGGSPEQDPGRDENS